MDKLVTCKQFNLLVNHLDAEYKEKPTVPEALDFIREVKGIPCAVDMDYFDGLFYYGKYLSGVEIKNTAQFDNHPEAENALLDAVLEYLIKNKP